MIPIARIFIIFGLILVVIGGLLYLAGRAGIPLGRLPGDIRIQGENISCIFPIVTMILISIILTVVLNLIVRILNR
jgi:hypothetical protein